MKDGKAFGQEIVTVVKGYVERSLTPLEDRLDTLEERIAALDGKKAMVKPKVRVKAGSSS